MEKQRRCFFLSYVQITWSYSSSLWSSSSNLCLDDPLRSTSLWVFLFTFLSQIPILISCFLGSISKLCFLLVCHQHINLIVGTRQYSKYKHSHQHVCNEWNFIMAMLKSLEFGSSFLVLLNLYLMMFFSFLSINRCMYEHIGTFPSFRQGFPLTLTLYVIFVEELG